EAIAVAGPRERRQDTGEKMHVERIVEPSADVILFPLATKKADAARIEQLEMLQGRRRGEHRGGDGGILAMLDRHNHRWKRSRLAEPQTQCIVPGERVEQSRIALA